MVRSSHLASSSEVIGTPTCRASSAVRVDVGTPTIFSPSSRTLSPRQRTIHAAVDPVPSPTFIPLSTNSTARLAATNLALSMGDNSAVMAGSYPVGFAYRQRRGWGREGNFAFALDRGRRRRFTLRIILISKSNMSDSNPNFDLNGLDWRRPRGEAALADVHRSIPVPKTTWRRFAAFLGPGYLVAVGYMDPGNWATSLAGGSKFGYTLLVVALVSNLMAIVLQSLCARLAIASGRDLAQACRDAFPALVSVPLWALAEIAIIATDIAEVIGTAIGLNLLFGIPLELGVLITALDVFLILWLQNKGFRWLEAFIITFLGVIAISFGIQIALADPVWSEVIKGFAPTTEIIRNPEMLYLAHTLIGPLLGEGVAPALFAVALLACGLNSTVTATLAGRAVMECFLQIRLKPWLRRLITRVIAIVPAAAVTIWYGSAGTGRLLILTQVILSLQLSFAVVPLVMFTADRKKMGAMAAPHWMVALAILIAVVIVGLNLKLLWDFSGLGG